MLYLLRTIQQKKLSDNQIVEGIEEYCSTGVEFICLPLGINDRILSLARKTKKRVIAVTSRCGGQIMSYMNTFKCENPYMRLIDEIIAICKKYGVALDMGDVFRSGCIEDGCDNNLKLEELKDNAKIGKYVVQNGVDVIYEGGGHIPLNVIGRHISDTRHIIGNVPLWYGSVLPTDRAVGFDSVANAIGISVAAMNGVDAFLAMSDSEHYACPTTIQTANAIRTVHVALSTTQYALGNQEEIKLNHEMGKARSLRNWNEQAQYSIFPRLTQKLFSESGLTSTGKPCNMCGEYCPLTRLL